MTIEATLKNWNTDSDWTNFLEIRVYGLMRSGNHAIIEWIQSQFPGEITCFLNNIKHGNNDPYTCYEQRVINGIDEQVDVETLRTMKKHLLIYSYEDRHELEIQEISFRESVFQPDFKRNRQAYLGKRKHHFDVLIIRDPFNFMASRLKLMYVRGPQGGVSDPSQIMKDWKILAREAIRLTRKPQNGKIVANFNQWVADSSYRHNLSQLLMGTFTDSSMENTSEYGGGSSFRDTDRLTVRMFFARWREIFNIRRYARLGHYLRRITAPDKKTNVFIRWKQLVNNEEFSSLFQDKEILEFSEELFGEIPGTREFVKSLNQ